ncbi:hypothetical protein LSTR_LSTR008584 [Laodelphax striatellus]|uniref:RING-CH-type domain-containing protein n=1 Tax=Laodelphax striatellus TaxID=195883 RepID=A0A482WW37_LAOST|nr:hypothetical protein LSTR_LSTR008584 [Laodelphax striatellus]
MTQLDLTPDNLGDLEGKEKIPIEKTKFPRETCCRICQTVISTEKLISPCLCKGSMAFVHLSCLERWLNQSGRDSCELCTFRYEAEQTKRYKLLEALRIWYRHPRHQSQLKSDIMMALVLTGVTAILVGICLGGMKYFVLEGLRLGVSYVWTEGIISFFLSVIIIGYVTTIYVMLRDNLLPFYYWWNRCVNVRLVLDMELVPVLEDDYFLSSSSSVSFLDFPGSTTGLRPKQHDNNKEINNNFSNRISQDAVIRIPDVDGATFSNNQNQINPSTRNDIAPVLSQIMANLFNNQAPVTQPVIQTKESEKDCNQLGIEIQNTLSAISPRQVQDVESTEGQDRRLDSKYEFE